MPAASGHLASPWTITEIMRRLNPRPVGLLPDPARRRGGGVSAPLLSPKLLRRFSKFKRCSIALSKFYLETKFH